MANLLEQREKYIENQRKAEIQREIEEYNHIVDRITKLFNNEELDPLVYDTLLKHGAVKVGVDRCLCGKNGCLSGEKIFKTLNERNVFKKYQDQGIEVVPEWNGFKLTLGDVMSGQTFVIYENTDNEIEIKWI